MSRPCRSEPCAFCPYRTDVPSGVWSAGEYAKLPAYDGPIDEQPWAPFMCHATPEAMCAGWAQTENTHPHGLIGLRISLGYDGRIPEPHIPCFATGAEAAAHGMRDIDDPSPEALIAMARLLDKHPRLSTEP